PWIEVRESRIIRPDGEPGLFGVVHPRSPASFVVALSDDDQVVLIETFRYPTQSWSIEIPAGNTDGEDPLVAARRELVEETGLTARDWRRVGAMNALNGVCRAPEVVYLATGLEPVPGFHGDTGEGARERALEGIRSVRRVPVADVLDLVRDGTVTDGETIAALMLALVHLGRVR
ncbi:MAG: NUDIX domain-containing protein, partial [Terrabacter sp.]